MQSNDLGLKRRVLVDGEEIPGLVETSEIMDEEGVIEVPGFKRKIEVKDGVSKLAPIDLLYKVQRDSNTDVTLRNWKYNDELHDVTIINTDSTGIEVDRILFRECECKKYNKRAYKAESPEFFAVGVTILCTTEPRYL
jgi:hypothetical protein